MVAKANALLIYGALSVFGCCCSIPVQSQDQKIIDSLTRLIKNDRSKSDLQIFYELTFEYLNKDKDSALRYIDEAMKISDSLGDTLKIVRTRRVKAQILRRVGRVTESIKYFSEALPIAVRNGYHEEMGYIFRGNGLSYLFLGRFDASLSSFFNAVEVWEMMGDQIELSHELTNIGFLHYRVGNNEKSIEYSMRSLSLKEQNKLAHTATTRINIGLAHIAQGNFATGFRFINDGLRSCHTDCSDDTKMQAAFGHGFVALGLRDFHEAEKKFIESYTYACNLSDSRFQADCLLWLGKALLEQHQLDSALRCLINAEKLSTKHGYRQMLMNAYFFMANVYKHAGDQDLSRQYVERYSILRDSLHSFEVRSKVLVAELEFERQQNQLEIQHKEELIRQKNAEYVLIVIVCLLLILIALGLVWLLRNKAKLNARLDEKIRERTRDLESHRAALERSFSEQSEMILKTSSSIKSALATHKGLRDTLAKEGISGERENFENIEDHLNKWAEELSKIQRTKTGI
jgi:two-component system sensor histidine kinase/response regulator